MRPLEAFIDANLLVLLIVGLVNRELVGKHRRTRNFSVEDYERLHAAVMGLRRVFVTPNTLTEASNLLGSKDRRLLEALRVLIEKSSEVMVASATAARHRAFPELGLTDAVLVDVVSDDRPLITADLELYLAIATEKGPKAAFNFVNRDLEW